MPFEIDYGSDATRSAGDWSMRRSPRPTGRSYDDVRASRGDLSSKLARYGLAAYDGDGRSPRDALAVSRSGREGWASVRAEPLFRGFCLKRRR